MNKHSTDFEKELAEIVEETALRKERIAFDLTNRRIKNIIKDCIYDNESKVGIIGYNEDLKRVERCLKPFSFNYTFFPVMHDKLCRNPVGTYKIEMEEELKRIASQNLDVMLVVSYDISHIITMYLITYHTDYRIVNFYDYIAAVYKIRLKASLGGNDIFCKVRKKIKAFLWYISKKSLRLSEMDFFKKTFRMENAFDSYDAIYSREQLCKHEKNPVLKNWYRNEIIDNYLNIYDFKTAVEYMKDYIEGQYVGYEKMNVRLERINNVLNELKELLKKRKKDIIFFWIDSISASERDKLGLYQKECEEGIFFENVYTHIPVTRETMFSIMSGMPFFESKAYEWTDVAHGKNYKYLREMGYEVKDIGAQLISRETGVLPKKNPFSFYHPTSVRLWTAMMELANADIEKLQCFFVHSVCESHNPYWGGKMSRMVIGPRDPFVGLDAYIDVIKEAEKYQETQIRWYAELLSDECCKVYFSDHGKGFPFWAEDKVRTFLAINDKRFMPQKVKQLFSYLDFQKLFRFLIDPEKNPLETVQSEYALIQNDEPYEKMVVEVKKHSLEVKDRQFFLREWMGFSGVVVDGVKIVKFRNGDKIILSLLDEEIIEENEIKKYEEITSLVGNIFSDLGKGHHYAKARELYETLKIPY